MTESTKADHTTSTTTESKPSDTELVLSSITANLPVLGAGLKWLVETKREFDLKVAAFEADHLEHTELKISALQKGQEIFADVEKHTNDVGAKTTENISIAFFKTIEAIGTKLAEKLDLTAVLSKKYETRLELERIRSSTRIAEIEVEKIQEPRRVLEAQNEKAREERYRQHAKA